MIDAEHEGDEQQQRRGEPEGLAVVPLLELFGEDRDEGGLERSVGEESADQVGDLEGDRERRHRPVDAVVAGGDYLPDQARDPRQRGGGREERGRAGDPARLPPRRRISARLLARLERLGGTHRGIGIALGVLAIGCVGCLGRLQAGSQSL